MPKSRPGGRALAALVLALSALGAQTPAVQLKDAEGSANFQVAGVVTGSVAALAAGEVRLVFDYQDASNYYYLGLLRDYAQFYRLRDNQSLALGVGGTLRREKGSDELKISLQRSDWGLAAVCNKVVVARAEGRTWPGGKLGTWVRGDGLSATLKDPQSLEDIFFSDDFMRTGENFGGWEFAEGKWQNNQQGTKTSRSANAFTFRSVGGAPLVAAHGHAFDRDYVVQCAMRCDNNGAVGLVVGYQDDANYYRLRWSAADAADGGTCRLQRVFGGKVTDLTPALPGGFQARTWYKLALSLAGGYIYGWIDDVPLFEVAAQAFGEGKIGLYSEPGNNEDVTNAGATFDDVVERSWPLFADDFTAPSQNRWGGANWKLAPAVSGGQAIAPAGGQLLCGTTDWQDTTFEADATCASGNVGLVSCRQPGKGYGLLAGPAGCQLVRFDGEQRVVLAKSAKALTAGATHRLSLSVDAGLLRAGWDGETVLEAFDQTTPAGPCGLWTEGSTGASFARVRCLFRPASYQLPPFLPPDFVQDRYMTAWASPSAAWIQESGTGPRWHKGFFYGDRKVHFSIPAVKTQEGKVTIALGASSTGNLDGYVLTVTLAKGADVALALSQGKTALREAKAKPEGEAAEVVFELRGKVVLVAVDGKVVLSQSVSEEKP